MNWGAQKATNYIMYTAAVEKQIIVKKRRFIRQPEEEGEDDVSFFF